jgi:pyroglutamyl-peptidase
MARPVALVTGFEPYGGRGLNPSSEVVKRVDGLEIEGHQVVGRVLPVSFRALRPRVQELMAEVDPALVVSLGLWPGEPLIRLEQIAVNVADFEIPDNDGAVLRDEVVVEAAPVAFRASLPLRAIERALLAAGIPARLSTTAGTFLCNATMYAFLHTPQAQRGARCGFVHVPYLPEQTARLLLDVREGRSVELHQRADLASMSLPVMVEAVRIVLAVSLGARGETGGSRPDVPA